ncbi:ATPase, T2SS/T4P/T4SS family [Cohnella soli]|uniref:ATPase, T2SS/T4P/T4SS family n=1 Tax=Cohnella soli TaxID=425005 RepID=A0ABW0HR81_9BACL
MSFEDNDWTHLSGKRQAKSTDMAKWLGLLQDRVLKELEDERARYGEIIERDELSMQRWLMDIIRHVEGIPTQHYQQLIKNYLDDSYRFGPVQPLWEKPGVTDVQIFMPLNPDHKQMIMYYDAGDRKMYTDQEFRNYDHLRDWVNQHLSRIGMRYDPSKIAMNGMLPGGERIHVISGTVGYSIYNALSGEYKFIRCMIVSIRRFAKSYTLEELTSTSMTQIQPIELARPGDAILKYKRQTVYAHYNNGFADAATIDYLRIAGQLRLNYLLSGATGVGKTTLMNALTVIVGDGEMLIVIEEAPEMQPQCELPVIRLYEREGIFTQFDALKQALRMFGNRICLAEIRDKISYLFLHTLMVGHDGSGSTIHASSCKAALDRAIELASSHESAPPREIIRSIMCERIGFIAQMSNDPKNRHIDELCEVNDDGTLHVVTRFVEGANERGRQKGYFEFLGPGEKFLQLMAKAGIDVPSSWKWGKAS